MTTNNDKNSILSTKQHVYAKIQLERGDKIGQKLLRCPQKWTVSKLNSIHSKIARKIFIKMHVSKQMFYKFLWFRQKLTILYFGWRIKLLRAFLMQHGQLPWTLSECYKSGLQGLYESLKIFNPNFLTSWIFLCNITELLKKDFWTTVIYLCTKNTICWRKLQKWNAGG